MFVVGLLTSLPTAKEVSPATRDATKLSEVRRRGVLAK